MDRHQLYEALQAAGIPAALYEIAGCPGGPWPTDRLYLEEQEGQWAVGVQERGVRRVLERFPDEDQACRSLYDLLTYRGPPPSPLTPEETGELLHDSESIQRRAREQLARALEAARRPPRGEAGT
ncbi:hypothetical protein [Streptomyces sp.]|uniref:hypothetical protein n=1 Tax=Streptomyces sp. TaxID=1931 RepID=UPI002F413AAE